MKFKLMDFTVPETESTSTKSPSLKGRNMIIITPAATFDSVPRSARPAAPTTATMEVVWIPKVFSTKRIVKVRTR